MSLTEKRLKTLEDEMMSLRFALEKYMISADRVRSKPPKDRMKLLDLFGAWDGEIDTFLREFSTRRERRGRLE